MENLSRVLPVSGISFGPYSIQISTAHFYVTLSVNPSPFQNDVEPFFYFNLRVPVSL
jgi:hypothetical protein